MMNRLLKAYNAIEKNNVTLIIKTDEDLEMFNNIIPLIERYTNKEFLKLPLERITEAKRTKTHIGPLLVWQGGYSLCLKEHQGSSVADKYGNVWPTAETEKKSRSAVGVDFMTSPEDYPEYLV